MSETPNYPNYPNYPTSGANQPAVAPPRPGTIEGAFWSFIASTVIGLVGGFLIFANRDTLVDTMRDASRRAGNGLTDAQIDQAVNITMIVAVVIAVIIAALYLLFAFKLRAGRNWARIVLTVITALQLLSVLAGQSTVLGYVAVLAAVIGVVLSFLTPSNNYIAAVKARP